MPTNVHATEMTVSPIQNAGRFTGLLLPTREPILLHCDLDDGLLQQPVSAERCVCVLREEYGKSAGRNLDPCRGAIVEEAEIPVLVERRSGRPAVGERGPSNLLRTFEGELDIDVPPVHLEPCAVAPATFLVVDGDKEPCAVDLVTACREGAEAGAPQEVEGPGEQRMEPVVAVRVRKRVHD